MLKEPEYRGKARALIHRTGYGPVGRHFKSGGDVAADKAMADAEIRKAMREHDAQLHGKGKHTRLKLAEGGVADGPAAKPRADRNPRGKKPSHQINILIAPRGGGDNQARPVPVPRPAMAAPPPAAPPRAGMPPGGMPMPMGGAAMPPRPPMAPPGLPMRKRGGKLTAGSGSGEGRRQKAAAVSY